MRRYHGYMTIFWGAMIPVSMLTGLKHSVPFLVGISVYALMGEHWAAWAGERAKRAAEQHTAEDPHPGE